MQGKHVLMAGLTAAAALPASAMAWGDGWQGDRTRIDDWRGPYAGIHAGYGWGRDSYESNLGTETNNDSDGELAGVQLGINGQSGNWVYGPEIDYQASRIDSSGGCVTAGGACNARLRSLATARARLGYDFGGNLLYGTAGYGVANVRFNSGAGGESHEQHGAVVGGGLESKLTPNWSWKAEYLYADLNGKRYDTAPGVTTKVQPEANIVRVGLNYHF